jgi:hypothetical protein
MSSDDMPEEPDPAGAADSRGGDAEAGGRRPADEPAWMWTDDDFTASPDFAGDYAADMAVGTPTKPELGPAIRRRAGLWVTTGLLGLAVGAAAFVKLPPPYKATTSVLVAQSADQPSADQILTEVALLQSHTVAAAAMRSLGLPVSVKAVERFSANITPTAPTDRVIQITVKATSSGQAVSDARATAAAFLRVRDDELRSAERLTITSLDTQIYKDKQQAVVLAAQIKALGAHGATPAQQKRLAGLKAQQSQLRSALTGLQAAVTNYEATTAVATAAMVRGSQVLDPATPLPRSHLRYPALYLGGGLLGGLAVGLAFVIVQALTSRRLRRRDDIARALGGPVQLSVGRVPGGRVPGGRVPVGLVRISRELLGRLPLERLRVGGPRAGGRRAKAWPSKASLPAMRRIVAHLLKSVPASTETSALAVIAVDDAAVPALSLVSLAATYAREGKRVLLADLTSDTVAGRLLGVSETGVKLTEADGHEVLVAIPEPGYGQPIGPIPLAGQEEVSPSAGDALGKAYRTADIMLTLATLDPALGADHLPTWASEAVVMVTAGKSSGTKIRAIGEMIRMTGTWLTSAVLLNSDKSDESIGLLTGQAQGVKTERATEELRPRASADAEPSPTVTGSRQASSHALTAASPEGAGTSSEAASASSSR